MWLSLPKLCSVYMAIYISKKKKKKIVNMDYQAKKKTS